MNNDLISRSALLEKIGTETYYSIDPYNQRGKIREMVALAPTVDAVSPGVLEQYKWERDTAIAQLKELGIGFGEKKPDMQPVRHGRWLKLAYDPAWTKCSECGCNWEWGMVENCNMIYCPNCGAKMDAEVLK